MPSQEWQGCQEGPAKNAKNASRPIGPMGRTLAPPDAGSPLQPPAAQGQAAAAPSYTPRRTMTTPRWSAATRSTAIDTTCACAVYRSISVAALLTLLSTSSGILGASRNSTSPSTNDAQASCREKGSGHANSETKRPITLNLENSGSLLEALWSHLGAVVGPLWDPLRPSWGSLGALLGPFRALFGQSWRLSIKNWRI